MAKMSEFRGVVGVHSYNQSNTFYFHFALMYIYKGASKASFVPLEKATEVLRELRIFPVVKDCFEHLLHGAPLACLKPKEDDCKWRPIKGDVDLVAFVINVDEEDNLLMVEERTGLWFLPAGHFEAGEDLLEAAKRETKEEAGVDVKISKIGEIIYGSNRSYVPLHFVVLADETSGDLKSCSDVESRSKRFPLATVIAEMKDPKIEQKYRKAFEILPFLEHYVEQRKSNNFITIY